MEETLIRYASDLPVLLKAHSSFAGAFRGLPIPTPTSFFLVHQTLRKQSSINQSINQSRCWLVVVLTLLPTLFAKYTVRLCVWSACRLQKLLLLSVGKKYTTSWYLREIPPQVGLSNIREKSRSTMIRGSPQIF